MSDETVERVVAMLRGDCDAIAVREGTGPWITVHVRKGRTSRVYLPWDVSKTTFLSVYGRTYKLRRWDTGKYDWWYTEGAGGTKVRFLPGTHTTITVEVES